MDNKQKQKNQEYFGQSSVQSIIECDRVINKKQPDVRDYLTNTLHAVLCDRYFVSYHTTKEKLIELVTQELSI